MKHLVFLIFGFFILVPPAFAQGTAKPESFTAKATAQDAQTLITSRYSVLLWGIEAAHVAGTPLSLHGRTAMDTLISEQPVRCDIVSWRGQQPVARCANTHNVDLAASMLQKGFAVVQRQSVVGTPYEELYTTAENTAKAQKKGIWAQALSENPAPAVSIAAMDDQMLLIGSVAGSSLLVLLILSLLMWRGFKNTEKLLKRSMAMTRAQEERMRKREKFVVAAMLEGELLSNKGKVEAFLVINRDMMEGLMSAKANNRPHKYQESTEIIQKTPILARSIFDGNTDKLELLGPQIAKDIVQLYNSIHAEADYITLQKSMPIEEAINEAQKIILRAEQLLDPIDQVAQGLQIILSDRKRPYVSAIKDEDMLTID